MPPTVPSTGTAATTPSVIITGSHAFKGHAVAGQVRDPTKKYYTWEEVAQHNTEKSCWIYVGKTVYDVTEWVPKHPGGKTMLLLAAGRDCTDLFDSYHPFTTKPRAILEKYAIGEIATTEYPQYKPDDGFYKELRAEVGAHFARTKTNPKDPLPGLWRLVLIVSCAALGWWVSHTLTASWPLRIAAAILFGVCQALPLLHTMHDCSHTSFGPSETWWLFFGRLTMDWMAGACLTSWHNQHIIGHHVYTNVLGADPDLPLTLEGDLRRVSKLQKWAKRYRFQHYYLFFLYGLLGIKFRIQDLTETMVKETNGPMRVNLPPTERAKQFVSKSCWFVWRIVVPLYFWGIPQVQFWSLWCLSEFVTGYYLAFNFQVSHVSPAVDFPDIQSGFHDTWAAAQVKTTVDYSHGNPIMTFLCGALNYQTVHHLFPCVSQYQYPSIAPIVMRICKKWNVPYTHMPSFWEAFSMHWRHLKQLGNTVDAHIDGLERNAGAADSKRD